MQTMAYPAEFARISTALNQASPARFFVTGGFNSGKSTLLDALDILPAFNGSCPADVYDHLPRALKNPGRVLIDDFDRVLSWLSEEEERALIQAIGRSPAHIVCTSTSEAARTGLQCQHIHLAPLSREAAADFYARLCGEMAIPIQANGEDEKAALRALTGGRPDRICYAARQLAALVNCRDWESILLCMADRYMLEDRGNIERLSAGQRGVWAALAETARGRAACTAEVSKRRRMTTGVASMHLKRLVDKGYAEVHKPTKSQFRYRIADPIAQGHYLMRRCGPRECGAVWREMLARETERAA